MSSRVLGIVPARLASTRLPNKPLYPVLGRPLIEWVWRRVESMKVLDHVVVATDSDEVAEVCRSLGAPVELTSTTHPSGTDRVAEVAGRPSFSSYGIIANIPKDTSPEQVTVAQAVPLLAEKAKKKKGTKRKPAAKKSAKSAQAKRAPARKTKAKTKAKTKTAPPAEGA